MTPKMYEVVSKFTDAELNIYFLGFHAGAGGYCLPTDEMKEEAFKYAKAQMSVMGEQITKDKALVAGVKVRITGLTDGVDVALDGGITIGKVYTIVGRDAQDEAYFIDDAGEENYAVSLGGDFDYEIVPE